MIQNKSRKMKRTKKREDGYGKLKYIPQRLARRKGFL